MYASIILQSQNLDVIRYNTREFFPYSFRPTQAKLHIWPSLIHNRYASQARYTHTYSDIKDALNTGVRNSKESIKKDVLELSSTSASPTGITAEMRGLSLMPLNTIPGTAELGRPQWSRSVLRKLEKGSTGICSALTSCIIVEYPPLLRVLAFERGAENYKAKNGGKQPVLILDNISKLGQKNVEMMEDLQDLAKLYTGQSSCVVVFVSSEGTSHAEKVPIFIRDLIDEEALTYLHKKLHIEEKVANQLIELLGGRINELKDYGNNINEGYNFEDVRKMVFYSIENDFHQAQIMEGEVNHAICNVIIQELVKNEKIEYNAFIKLVNNKEIADKLIQANVFSYNPENKFVTFQSRAKEIFVKENPGGVFSYSKQ
ncbi:9963_t:CDS:2 [Funneliformis geosporum]|uniref:9963_t:CDS:1 n=1 Tax=Funneliformis geosporum TaxID=1117311 RepID=A0A9W4T4E2_9GLOM|nr:9963_t:CDS:2 [Funneliformis geosporum]